MAHGVLHVDEVGVGVERDGGEAAAQAVRWDDGDAGATAGALDDTGRDVAGDPCGLDSAQRAA